MASGTAPAQLSQIIAVLRRQTLATMRRCGCLNILKRQSLAIAAAQVLALGTPRARHNTAWDGPPNMAFLTAPLQFGYRIAIGTRQAFAIPRSSDTLHIPNRFRLATSTLRTPVARNDTARSGRPRMPESAPPSQLDFVPSIDPRKTLSAAFLSNGPHSLQTSWIVSAAAKGTPTSHRNVGRCRLPLVPLGAPPMQLDRVVDIRFGKALPAALAGQFLHAMELSGIVDTFKTLPGNAPSARHKNVLTFCLCSDEVFHLVILNGVWHDEESDAMLAALS